LKPLIHRIAVSAMYALAVAFGLIVIGALTSCITTGTNCRRRCEEARLVVGQWDPNNFTCTCRDPQSVSVEVRR
jgi:hypothetical protein